MFLAALILLFGSVAAPAKPPVTAADIPVAATADDRTRDRPWTSTRTRAEVRAEAIEAARAAPEQTPR